MANSVLRRFALFALALALVAGIADALTVDLLIRRKPNRGHDTANSSLVWRLGDIILWKKWQGDTLAPRWGAMEDPTLFIDRGETAADCGFFIVTLTDVPVNQVTLTLRDIIEGTEEYAGTDSARTIRLRNWTLHPRDVPAGVRTTLINTGRYSVDAVTAFNFLKDRRNQ